MSLVPGILLLAALPIAVTAALLTAHLATLRGLHGHQRVHAFRLFANALRSRR
ncbi:hypothetical protein [Streptomyces yaizuensis]|uniref:Uncharacterized protein n=1 Tax=Streptomyces yaizuensis TaxID=2989713 RepID=A0ABQ5P7Q9_9ACTN|nr:hypothetical protein [Streptomyces sp. YSPA8]GLF98625.1 hypothetical protein SYYSPA8_30030 [Streptomyces sp. YSPA8]